MTFLVALLSECFYNALGGHLYMEGRYLVDESRYGWILADPPTEEEHIYTSTEGSFVRSTLLLIVRHTSDCSDHITAR